DEGNRYVRVRGRVRFPIRNARGLTIGFGARVIGAGEPKYLNSPETPVFRKGQELYGLFEAREAIRRSGRAIVCEGYMDVIRLAQAGFGESVAALGTAVTATHVSALLRVTDHVVFAFDGDAAGRKAARRALEATLAVIGDSKRASFVLLGEDDDPDSLIDKHGPEGFERALKGALPLSQFLLTTLGAARSMKSAEDRAAVVSEAKPLLVSMPSGALRLQLLRELSDATRTPMEDLESLYGLRPGRPRRPAPLERRSPRADVADLKRRILSQLLIHPALANAFADVIAAEHLDSDEPLDLAIVEVWRAAETPEGQGAQLTHGVLLELLTESPRIDEYRAVAAQEMEVDTDVDTARDDLEGAFQKLRQQRLEHARTARLADYEREPSPEHLEAYRTADLAYTEARAVPPPGPRP
ncbi:MAG: toprim domain-containing protein, partial [Burkholderiaceae bacterium]